MRPFRFIATALSWGVVVGLAQGFWLLGPLILRTHHIVVETRAQWIELALILVALFAGLGALLGAVIGSVAVAWLIATRRRPHDAVWVVGVVTAVAMIPMYLGSGALIYFIRFGHFAESSADVMAFASAMPAAIVVGVGMAIFHQLISRRLIVNRSRIFAWSAAVISLVGALVLPARVPMAAIPTVEAHAVPTTMAAGERRPLLVLAIDGGNWRTVQPLVDAGRLKTFNTMIRTGFRGEVDAEWPPFWSTSAWGAIATGFSREEVGVFGDLVATLPGLPPFQPPLELDPRLVPVSAVEYALTHTGMLHVSPPPRSALKEPPVWELLERSGVKTAVVRFNFTYPAEGQASVVISNRVVPDMWDTLGVATDRDGALAAPVARTRELMAPFSDSWTPNRNELFGVLPALDRPRPRDALMDPVAVLQKVMPYDQRTFRAAENIVRSDPDISVTIVHIGGFDNISHAFWQYRFPGDFNHPPAAADIEALGPVIDRYLEFIDRGLAGLIAAFPTAPNVLIVSDHGEGAANAAAPWRGVHASPGMLLAAGPDVPHRSDLERVSYYDIVPTILDLQHLEKSPEMRGRSLIQTSEEGP